MIYCCLLSEVLFAECPISCCLKLSVNSFSFPCLLGLDVQLFFTVEKKNAHYHCLNSDICVCDVCVYLEFGRKKNKGRIFFLRKFTNCAKSVVLICENFLKKKKMNKNFIL